MLKKSAIAYLAVAFAAITFTCCNSDYESGESVSSSAVVSEFTLSADDSVAANLDSVYFSIDLVKCRIWNADSLPFGTARNKLVPIISTLDGASVAELTVKRDGLADTVFDYLTNPGDTIDFTYPVELRLVSNDGNVTRRYTIEVNVHNIKPDSLAWSRAERRNLPSTFAVPNEQCTAATASAIFCLTRYQADYCMATAANPADEWALSTPTFGFTPDILSMRATDDALYILSDAGDLYTSTDGLAWTSCGLKAGYLYGGYCDLLLANRLEADGTYTLFTCPASTERSLPADFPVSGTSLPVTYTFDMSLTPMTLITAGRLANGSLSGDTWAFDGSEWAKLSEYPLATPVESPVVVPYFVYKESSSYWVADRYSVLVAFGGKKANGHLSSTVFISLDFGMTWKEADSLMQLPSYFPAMSCAQGFVYEQTLGSRSSLTDWTAFPIAALPRWAAPICLPSRVTTAITEWDCPFIYVFGGLNENGSLYNTVWRGAINRFTFKPLY